VHTEFQEASGVKEKGKLETGIKQSATSSTYLNRRRYNAREVGNLRVLISQIDVVENFEVILILGALAKIRKATVSFVTSVCFSVCSHGTTSALTGWKIME